MSISTRLKKLSIAMTGISVFVLGTGNIAQAASFGGVEFPKGEISFVDAVVSYEPFINSDEQPLPQFREPSAAIGIPDYGGDEGTCQQNCTYVSLGSGGRVTLQFIDNFLTGSGDSDFDLWIFEIGGDVERTFVDISKDGHIWHSIGEISGSTSGIDIDMFGWTREDLFSYVRLTDDPNSGNPGTNTPGSDIDAVGAISSVPAVSVPETSSTLGLLITSVFSIGSQLSRKQKSTSSLTNDTNDT